MEKLVSTLLVWLCTAPCWGFQVNVTVQDKSQAPLANVVVQLIPQTPFTPPKPSQIAVMDQVKSQFKPHILVVQKDSLIDFPNSDSIKHHVYSFSSAKTFELKLYKGFSAQPLAFEKAGVVELGCNVHDWMLGYIYVADTPYFAKTDANGSVLIEVPAGEYQLTLWNPRIQDPADSLLQTVQINANLRITHQLNQGLLPSHLDHESDVDEFSDYD